MEESEKSIAQKAQEVASAAKSTAKAGAKLATGNVMGAAGEVLKNPGLLKVFVSVILFMVILLNGIILCVGVAIWGAVEAIANSYQENYDEAWEKHGISSSGSMLYLYDSNQMTAVQFEAIGGTIADIYNSVVDHLIGGEDATNNSLGNSEDNLKSEDVQTTLGAITENDEMMEALNRRLELIKTRVMQRGEQIEGTAMVQYSLETIGNMAADIFTRFFDNPFLFAGISDTNLTVDTSCFELTDIQALKILCAYSTQYDGDYTSVDMWSLMDYLGWYGPSRDDLPSPHLAQDSIYAEGSVSATTGGGLDGVFDAGTDITSEMVNGVSDGTTVYTFKPLQVPYWSGEFKPQWYIEEQAAIKKHNEKYWDYVEKGVEVPDDVTLWGHQESRNAPVTGFTKMDEFRSFGIIDKLFTTSTAKITVTPTELQSYTEAPREALGSLWQGMKDLWNDLLNREPDTSFTDAYGNEIDQTYISFNNGVYDGISYTCNNGWLYKICDANGEAVKTVRSNGDWVTFDGLTPNSTYSIYQSVPSGSGNHGNNGEIMERTVANTWEKIFVFKTASPVDPSVEAYKIDVSVDITYSSQSVDQLITDVMGLWAGSLDDTVTTATGVYQAGEAENPLLLKTWTDTCTDSNGNVQTITFERKNGYQAENYKESVIGLGKTLGFDVEHIYEQGASYGHDIVATALAEYESYEGTGGAKYWQAYADYNGCYAPSADTAWCVAFVYYCANQCGYLTPEGDGCFGSTWQINCGVVWDWFNDREQLMKDSSYVPNPGDLILYGRGNPYNPDAISHIGIVEQVTEDGELITIEGNYDNRLSRNTFGNYAIGSSAGGNGTIIAYCTPQYPQNGNVSELLFTQTGNSLRPTKFAKIVGKEEKHIIAGIPRMTRLQIEQFVVQLPTQDSEFASQNKIQALIKAVQDNVSDVELARTWNNALYLENEKLSKLQIEYASKNIATPIQQSVLLMADFNWGRSTARLEILWAIVSSTSNVDAAEDVLAKLAEGVGNRADDKKVIENYALKIASILNKYESVLWDGYDTQTKQQWKDSLISLIPLLQVTYLTDKAE